MFREDKTTQMAARFLALRGGQMDYTLLLKFLYYADKEMLVQRGRPITYDQWFSMNCGPVLSQTYDLIKAAREHNADSYWARHIHTEGYNAVMMEEPGSDALSPAEDKIIEQVFKEHGSKELTQVIREIHDLPECHPDGSSRRISYRDVLTVEGLPPAVIEEVLEHIAEQDDLGKLPA